MTLPRIDLLGLRVHAITRSELLDELVSWLDGDRPRRMYYTNAHVFNLAWENDLLRQSLNGADLLIVEGHGGNVGARLAGTKVPATHNTVYWMDDYLSRAAERHARVYLIGDEPGVADRAAAVMVERHPGLNVVGTHDGFFDAATDARIVEGIRRAEPDVLLVGMGTPRQEFWIDDRIEQLDASTVLALGAWFRWYAGIEAWAPPWMRRLHLEWLHRFLSHPVRHFRRYAIGNPLFVARCLGQRWRKPIPAERLTLGAPTSAVVAVCTRDRVESLQRTLTTVQAAIDNVSGWDISILVVNNGQQSIADVVPANTYVVRELQPGVATARNTAVRWAGEHGADVLVFTDDDTVVDPGWLTGLLGTLAHTQASVVTGPLVPVLPEDTPAWLGEQALLRRSRARPTGTLVRQAATHNVAFDLRRIRASDLVFDTTLDEAGGEDTELTRRLVRLGHPIIWCDEAIIQEPMNRSRASFRWLMRRSHRIGSNRRYFVPRDAVAPLRHCAILAGSVIEVLGAAAACLVLPFSRRRGVALLARAARGLGALQSYMLGYRAREYAA